MTTKSLDLQEEIIEELAFTPRVDADDVAVTTNDGIVTLRGTVPSFIQKWDVEEIVKGVRGVRGIADELIVDLPGMHVRSDTDIARAIEHRFFSNASIPTTVQFVVKDGHVTLTGHVRWHYQSQEAALEARPVTGVRDVTNLITVKPAASFDAEEIKRKIRSAFARTADLEANNVAVEVSGDAVTLSGSVRTWYERDKAARAAWSLPGVMRVENRIDITPWALT
jgi:osmotically-inducible protein OsmY